MHFFGLDYEGLLFLHGCSTGCTAPLLLTLQVHGLCSLFFLTVSHSVSLMPQTEEQPLGP
jgi:hypothetical protein